MSSGVSGAFVGARFQSSTPLPPSKKTRIRQILAASQRCGGALNPPRYAKPCGGEGSEGAR